MTAYYNAAGENIHPLHTRETREPTPEELAEALGAKRDGAQWKAHCPICKNRALGIGPGREAETVVNCLTGCNQDSVLDALREEGLWPRKSRRTKGPGKERKRNLWQGKVGADARKQKAGGDTKRPEQEEATEQAQQIWEASEDASGDHPYLAHKKVPPHGLKQASLSTVKEGIGHPPKADGEPMEGPLLVIPIHANSGTLKGVQLIDRGGRKTLPKGTPKKGHYHLIGEPEDGIYIAEGYATAASIYEADGEAVAVAFDAGNLKSVAQNLKIRYPDAELIFCADDDADKETEGKKNAGLEAAREAARAVGGTIVIPPREGEGIKRDFNDLAIEEGIEAVQEALRKLEAPEPEETPENTDNGRFKLQRVGTIEVTEPQWLIRGILEQDSLGMVFGDPGCGKSFLAVDWACRVASAHEFAGHEVSRGGPVVYLAGEGRNGLARRFKAWSIRHNEPLENLSLYISNRPASLCDADNAAEVREAVDEAAEAEGPPALVIVDTLARNFGPGNEDKTEDMSYVVSVLDSIRAAYQCAVLLVHHTGHSDKNRGRGSMALKGALDAEYRLEKDKDGVVTATAMKMKDAPEPDPLAFKMQPIPLGFNDSEGEPVTSAVLDPTSLKPSKEESQLEIIAELVRGIPQKTIAKQLHKSASWISQIKGKEAVEWGYLGKDGRPTERGWELAERYPPPEPGSGG